MITNPFTRILYTLLCYVCCNGVGFRTGLADGRGPDGGGEDGVDLGQAGLVHVDLPRASVKYVSKMCKMCIRL